MRASGLAVAGRAQPLQTAARTVFCRSVASRAVASSAAATRNEFVGSAHQCSSCNSAAAQPKRTLVSCHSTGQEAAVPAITSPDDVVRVAAVGDLVTIHFTCKDENGEVLQSSHTDEEGPITFELGAGEIMGNRLFQGFDEAVRGMAVGQTSVIEASGGEWQRDLLFSVPRDHPEVQRLEGRYKNQGGLAPSMIIELSNQQLAVVVDITDTVVRIDANNMMAGKTLTFEIELLDISKPPDAVAGGSNDPVASTTASQEWAAAGKSREEVSPPVPDDAAPSPPGAEAAADSGAGKASGPASSPGV